MSNKSPKSTITSIISVSLSNIIKLFSGVFIGFMLPSILGVIDYGFYKTFTLYIGYVSLFSVGITDGIYLKYGGTDYGNLNKQKMRYITRFYVLVQGIASCAGTVISFLLFKDDYRFIFLCSSLYLFLSNLIGYFQIVSQITSRFEELSKRNTIQSALLAVTVLFLYLLKQFTLIKIDYRCFIIIYLLIYVVLSIWYIITYQEIVCGSTPCFNKQFSDLLNLSKLGMPLLLANLCSSFILLIDRQFVSIFFATDEYAVYAFSYNMLSLITTVLAAISTVMYPMMKQSDEKRLLDLYPFFESTILLFVFFLIACFFPLKWFIPNILPNYYGSISIFRVIVPGIAISSVITIVIHNYYKTFNVNSAFCIQSILVLLISCVFDFFAYKIFKTTIAISVASIVSLMLWYIITERHLKKIYHIKSGYNFPYLLVMSTIFYISSGIDRFFVGMMIYLSVYLIVSLLFFHKNIFYYLKMLRRKQQSK